MMIKRACRWIVDPVAAVRERMANPPKHAAAAIARARRKVSKPAMLKTKKGKTEGGRRRGQRSA
jgi:hypothetical protein